MGQSRSNGRDPHAEDILFQVCATDNKVQTKRRHARVTCGGGQHRERDGMLRFYEVKPAC